MDSSREVVNRLQLAAEPGTILGPMHDGRLMVVLSDGVQVGIATMPEIDAAAMREPRSVSEYMILMGRRPGRG